MTSPRKIKRTPTQIDENTKNSRTYQLYQQLVSTSILLLKNGRDKLNYSSWLIRLNEEEKNSKILHLVKILYISIQNNRTYLIFREPPPKDLSVFNLEADHTVEMIEYYRVATIEDYKNNMSIHEDMLRNSKSTRSAAVSSDMLSYSMSKSSRYIVQSFYARSDFPINTWYNDASIEVPVGDIDHNQWELYLTRFNLISQNKNKNKTERSNSCEAIMKMDQVSKEVTTMFSWHPHSILFTPDKPKKSAAFYDIDSYVLSQPVIQQQIDEAAFAVVHNKSFPGYKMLNPKVYSAALMPDPVYVFKMTGVRMTYISISPCSFKSCTRQWVRADVRGEPDCAVDNDNNNNSCCPAKKQKRLQQDCEKRQKPVKKPRDCQKPVKKPRDCAQQPAEARSPPPSPPCKRVTTLNVTDFRNPTIADTGDAAQPVVKTTEDEAVVCPNASETDVAECGAALSCPKPPAKCPDACSEPPVCTAAARRKSECKPADECTTGPSNNNSRQDKSLNNTTDYDWTRFSDETSTGSTRKDSTNDSSCNAQRKNDQISRRTSTKHSGLKKHCTTVQNSRKSDTLGREPCDTVRSNESPIKCGTSYDEFSDDYQVTLSDECSFGKERSQDECEELRCPMSSTMNPQSAERWGLNRRSERERQAQNTFTSSKNYSGKRNSFAAAANSSRPPACSARQLFCSEKNADDYDEPETSRGFREFESRGRIEDVSMPEVDYATSCSSDDCASVRDHPRDAKDDDYDDTC